MKILAWICRSALVLLFVAASIPKIMDPGGFAQAVYRYGLLPLGLISPVAMLLPWIELTVAAALLGPGDSRRAGAWLALGLLAVFAIAIGWNLALGRPIPCGCFSTDPFSVPANWGHVAANLAACAAAWIAGSGAD